MSNARILHSRYRLWNTVACLGLPGNYAQFFSFSGLVAKVYLFRCCRVLFDSADNERFGYGEARMI